METLWERGAGALRDRTCARAGQRAAAATLPSPGPLAQLAEQGTLNPKVAGSIPARPNRKGAAQPPFSMGAWRLVEGAVAVLPDDPPLGGAEHLVGVAHGRRRRWRRARARDPQRRPGG